MDTCYPMKSILLNKDPRFSDNIYFESRNSGLRWIEGARFAYLF